MNLGEGYREFCVLSYNSSASLKLFKTKQLNKKETEVSSLGAQEGRSDDTRPITETEPSVGDQGKLAHSCSSALLLIVIEWPSSSLHPRRLAYPSFLGMLVGRHENLGAGLTISPTPFALCLLHTFLHQENDQENSHSKYAHWIIVFNFMVLIPHIGFSQLLVSVLDDQI